MTTQRAKVKFTVKEGAPSRSGASDAPVWLMAEPMDGEIAFLERGFLGVDLPPGISLAKAQEIARFLNSSIAGVSYTKL